MQERGGTGQCRGHNLVCLSGLALPTSEARKSTLTHACADARSRTHRPVRAHIGERVRGARACQALVDALVRWRCAGHRVGEPVDGGMVLALRLLLDRHTDISV